MNSVKFRSFLERLKHPLIFYGFALSSFYFLSAVVQSIRTEQNDFAPIYIASSLLKEGKTWPLYQPLGEITRPSGLQDYVALKLHQEIGIQISPQVYHPVLLMLFFPLSFLDYSVAKSAFLLLNILSLFLIVLVFLKERPLPKTEKMVFIMLVLYFLPIRYDILSLQMNLFVLLFILLWLHTRNEVLSAFFLVFAILSKPQLTIFLLVIPLFRRNWRVLLYLLLWFVLLNIVSLWVVGRPNFVLLLKTWSSFTSHIFSYYQNQSVLSFLVHLTNGNLFQVPRGGVTPLKGYQIAFEWPLFLIGLLLSFWVVFKMKGSRECALYLVFFSLLPSSLLWIHYLAFEVFLLPYFIGEREPHTYLYFTALLMASFPPDLRYPAPWEATHFGLSYILLIAAILLKVRSHRKEFRSHQAA